MSDTRRRLTPALLLVPAVLAMAYFSTQIILGTAGSLPGIRTAVLVVLICLWVAGIPILLVKPVNVAVLRLAGARVPSGYERASLDSTWHGVLGRAGVAAGRYQLVIVDRELPISRDLGWHVVAVDAGSVRRLDDVALSGLLAQRLARQTSWVAPLLGVCAWLALPLALFLCLAALLAFVAYSIARGAGAAAKGNIPETEGQLGCWVLVAVVALAAFLLALIIGLTILLYLVVALVIVVAGAWLARTADVAADEAPVRWGYQSPMLAAMTRLDAMEIDPPAWFRPLSTEARPRTHVGRLQRLTPPA